MRTLITRAESKSNSPSVQQFPTNLRTRLNSISLVAFCLLLVQRGDSSAQITNTAVVLTQTNVTQTAGFGCSFGQSVGYAYSASSRAVMWCGSFSNAIALGP